MQIEHTLMPCDCTERSCPVFNKCCFLPTECHPDPDGKISLLFVGQGGGSDERMKGRPFIGRAGQRLRQQVLYVRQQMKKHIGIAFSNSIRDNPEGNRVPTQQEYDFCLKYLYQDIEQLKKIGLKVVIPLGNASKSVFIPEARAMNVDHGKLFDFSHPIFGGIKVMPTYHPSFVIRNAPKFDPKQISEHDKPVLKDIIKAYEYSIGVTKDEPKSDLDIDVDVSELF